MSLNRMTRRLRGVLSPVEVAGKLGITPLTLSNWIERGYVEPSLTDGGKPYFSLERVAEIRRLLDTPVEEQKLVEEKGN